jgi:hypothetical protein
MSQKRAEKLRRRKARQLKGTRRRSEPQQDWAAEPRNIDLINMGNQSVLTEPLVPLETVLAKHSATVDYRESVPARRPEPETSQAPTEAPPAPRRLHGKALHLSYSTLALLAGMSDIEVQS